MAAYISMDQRRKLPLSEFGDPANRKFPAHTEPHFQAAVHLVGKAKNPAAVKRRLIQIAKRKGYMLPQAWQMDSSPSK